MSLRSVASALIGNKIKSAQTAISETVNATNVLNLLNGKSASSFTSGINGTGASLNGTPKGNISMPLDYSSEPFRDLSRRIKAQYGLAFEPEQAKMLERHYVNRLGVNLVDNILSHYRFYVFIGKPSCYLYDGTTPRNTIRDQKLVNLLQMEYDLLSILDGNIKGRTPFLTPLQGRVTSFTLQDAQLSRSESAANTRGVRQEYGVSIMESLINVPVTMTFSMDRNAEVLKITEAWVRYISGVRDGTVLQSPEDDALNRMGYTVPIWGFATEEDSKSIVFWCKATGNYPTNVPHSSMSSQGIINRDAGTKEISINFLSTVFSPFDPAALVEFNNLSANRTGKTYITNWVPYEQRDLSYYWTSGAEVFFNPNTNKYELRFYTQDANVDLTTGQGVVAGNMNPFSGLSSLLNRF